MKNPSQPREGSYFWSILCLSVGLSALVVTAWANGQLASTFGSNTVEQNLQAAMSLIIEFAFAAMTGTCTFLLTRRCLLWGIPCGVIAVLLGAYSLVTLFGFIATSRLAVAERASAEREAEKKQIDDGNAAILKERHDNMAFLRREFAKAKGRDKELLLTQMQKAVSVAPELKKSVDPGAFVADTQGASLAFLAKQVGLALSPRDAAHYAAMTLSGLFILIKSYFLLLGVSL